MLVKNFREFCFPIKGDLTTLTVIQEDAGVFSIKVVRMGYHLLEIRTVNSSSTELAAIDWFILATRIFQDENLEVETVKQFVESIIV